MKTTFNEKYKYWNTFHEENTKQIKVKQCRKRMQKVTNISSIALNARIWHPPLFIVQNAVHLEEHPGNVQISIHFCEH